jgi:protein-S-isoprenylcysteine O-methyltransferase Ste14
MTSRFWILLVALISFSAYTLVVVADRGYTGFITLAWQEPWGGQMFVDLVIALTLFLGWMLLDARRLEIPTWPYIALIFTTGSIGALAYLVHRTAKAGHAPIVDASTA